MPDFSESDINEAKRRVFEMRNRASHFVDKNDNISSNTGSPKTESRNNEQKKQVEAENKNDNSSENDNDKSSFIILILILLLSQEGADNTLILALLYLLL